MGYGTILSPTLIAMGFDPLLVIPSVLVSQSAMGITAGIFYHKLGGVDFHPRSFDFKVISTLIICGIPAVVVGAFLATSVPTWFLKIYIGALVMIIGFMILLNFRFKFSWGKIIGVGVLSAFNKAMSAGGFGPVVTVSQLISGRKVERSIGSTLLAEAPICLFAFLIYLSMRGLANWELPVLLTIGATLATPLGVFWMKKLRLRGLKTVLGVSAIFLGVFTISRMVL
jgi:hypothetical protein